MATEDLKKNNYMDPMSLVTPAIGLMFWTCIIFILLVLVLKKFFSMTGEQATQVMMKVHREGVGVCGVFAKDVATTKVELVAGFSRQHQHPLQCTMEEA